MQHELRRQLDVHGHLGSERQRILHWELHLPHQLHRLLLGDMLDRVDLRPAVPDGQCSEAHPAGRSVLTSLRAPFRVLRAQEGGGEDGGPPFRAPSR